MIRDKVTDRQYKEYSNRRSRYELFPYYYNITDNKYFYGLTAHIKKNIRYISHKVQEGDTLDNLSLYYYGNPLYYWAIADFNNINDPYIDLKIDEIIKIPTLSDIDFNI